MGEHHEHTSLLAPPVQEHDTTESDANIKKLLLTCVLTLIFFGIEVVGGYITHSLSLFSDAAHMLSDSTSLIISVLALWVARQPASDLMTFGYKRAEVLAAFVSVLFIWTVTVVLIVQAIGRLIEPEEVCGEGPKKVDGKGMIITGLLGLFFNVSKGLVLEHSHGVNDECCDHGNGHDDPESFVLGEADDTGFLIKLAGRLTGVNIANPAVRAAFLCVITDSMQNVVVIIAGILIMKNPHWTFVDPCVTFLFSAVVVLATKDLARQTLGILMEGTPRNLQVPEIRSRLRAIESVVRVEQLRAWSITLKDTALTVHITKDNSASDRDVLKQAEHILKHEFKIDLTTVQVEVAGSAVL